MRSYCNFFNPPKLPRSVKSTQKGTNGSDKVYTLLRLMRGNPKKEGQSSKVVKKYERGYLKEMIDARKNCIF